MNSSSVNHPAVYCVCITSMTHMNFGLVSPELHKFPTDFVHEEISYVLKLLKMIIILCFNM